MKQLFALSPTECGELVAKTSARQSCKFIHDPQLLARDSMSGDGGGRSSTTKTVGVDPINDGDGFFFNFKSETSKLTVPVTAGEYIVTRQVMLNAIPHMLGLIKPPVLLNNWRAIPGSNQRHVYKCSSQGGGYRRGGAATPSGDGAVFNPFEHQQHGDSSGRQQSKSSNWLDEL